MFGRENEVSTSKSQSGVHSGGNSHSATEVSPSSDESVRCTDDLLGKHAGRPVLAHDESASSKADEESNDSERSGAVDEAGQCAGDTGEA